MILRVAVFAPIPGTFDYLPSANPAEAPPAPGARVVVPFGRAHRIGVVVAHVASSPVGPRRLKRIRAALDSEPLVPSQTLALAHWASDYYRHALGEVLAAAVPVPLRRGGSAVPAPPAEWVLTDQGRAALAARRRAPRQQLVLELIEQGRFSAAERALLDFDWQRALRELERKAWVKRRPGPAAEAALQSHAAGSPIVLNEAQDAAVREIVAAFPRFQTILLQGVTGSGKTEVYLRAAAEAIARGRQVLVLIPEIALTEQFIARVRGAIAGLSVVIHSGLTGTERVQAWRAAREGRANVVLGTRSALWTPCARLGLIVVDEEHEASYKQGEGFRYSARDTAIVRARQENVPIVLGSATPSFESLLNVSLGKYSALTLPRRAGDAQLPTITCVDLRRTQSYSGISLTLQAAIAQRLERGEQCLMFVNRRGYAPVLLCQSCGWSAQCERCSARLVYHKQDSTLICHHCGAARRWTSEPRCCARPSVIAAGAGTERIEEGLKRLFPGVRVARIDRDSTRRKGSRAALFEAVHRNAVDVLVGTQMLAKGHHFPEVTLVGVLDADSLLYGADFRSTERLAQQIVQVAGRAGRAGKPGEVLVQTHFPGHPLLTRLLREGYAGFARRALQERRAAQLPPYTSLALLRAEAPGANAAPAFLDSLARALRAIANLGAEVLGPAPAPMQRRAGRYRWQLLLLAKSRTALKRALDHVLDVARDAAEARRVRWSLDIDPQDMI